MVEYLDSAKGVALSFNAMPEIPTDMRSRAQDVCTAAMLVVSTDTVANQPTCASSR